MNDSKAPVLKIADDTVTDEPAEAFGVAGMFRSSEAVPATQAQVRSDVPSMNGLPIHGTNNMLRSEELRSLEPKSTGYVRVLDLTNEDHVKEYAAVVAAACKGTAMVVKDLTQYDEKLGGWRMLLVWREFFYDTNKAARADAEVGPMRPRME